jgi:hypothetical protein
VALDKAESALIAHGFKSPAAVVAGLHLACRAAHCDDLYNFPLATLRKTAEPMLAAVPADLVAAFLADWPAKAPKPKEGAK